MDKVKSFAKCAGIGLILGLLGGVLGWAFHAFIELATDIRVENSFLICLLPLAGVLITAIYSRFGNNRGNLNTNRVIASAEVGRSVPLVLAPLIFAGTIITHLFGGSVGREGAALQLGGSLGYNIGSAFKADEDERRVLVMSGMSAFFSAMFGTPLTAAVFSLEVIRARCVHRRGLVPCVLASFIAYEISAALGTHGVRFEVAPMQASLPVVGKTALLALLCALVCIVFLSALKYTSRAMCAVFKNGYLRAFAGGAGIVILTALAGTTDYNGAGMDVISRAMSGEAASFAFAIKIIFTAITIASGFRGGEIVPTLFIGATFGCAAGAFLGLDPAFSAAVGFTALFAGVVKCPLAALLLAFEVFGGDGIMTYALAVVIACALSWRFCIYEHAELPKD